MASKKNVVIPEAFEYPEMECYQIEENVALPTRYGRRTSTERIDFIHKIIKMFDRIGLSMVIKKSDHNLFNKLLKSDYPELKMRFSKIKDNPKYIRVHRLA